MIDCNLFGVGFYEWKSFGELWSDNILNYSTASTSIGGLKPSFSLLGKVLNLLTG